MITYFITYFKKINFMKSYIFLILLIHAIDIGKKLDKSTNKEDEAVYGLSLVIHIIAIIILFYI